jgi:nitroreductase
VENLLIAAQTLGYGACWVGAFDEEAARKALEIPRHLRPVAIVPVGPCRPVTKFPDRRPAESVFKVVE